MTNFSSCFSEAGSSLGGGVGGATYLINTIARDTLPSDITFTRASTGTNFDSSGAVISNAVNVPRFDFDPSLLTPNGLLVEGTRTNSVRNSSMVGLVAGTPGTLPTNWVNFLGGLSQQVVGTGTEKGMPYIDWRVFGTTVGSNTTSISFDTTTGIIAATGQVWTNSFWVSLVGGSLANISSSNMRIIERDAVGATLVSGTQNILSSITATPTRFSYTRTLTNAGTLRITPGFDVNYIGAALNIDATFRIYGTQTELGEYATSYIPTTTTAVARSSDIVSILDLSKMNFNPLEGTIIVEAVYPALLTTSGQRLAEFSDGTGNFRMGLGIVSGGALAGYITDAAVTQASLNAIASPVVNTVYRIALAYKFNDFAACGNGGTVATDFNGTVPVVNRLTIGGAGSAGVSNQLNGWVRQLTYYPTRLPNATLRALTT